MSRLIVVALAAFAFSVVSARIDSALDSNRTPKKAAILFHSVCDECQDVVGRFRGIAEDPDKMAKMKGVLSGMCEQTSMVEECKVFANKMDLFTEKIMKYLKNPQAVCKKFHMCGNSRLDQFHRIGLIYAKKHLNAVDGTKDLGCEECQFAAHELASLLEEEAFRSEVRAFFSENLCDKLGSYKSTCELAAESYLPDLMNEVHDLVQSQKQFCRDLSLCHRETGVNAVVPERRRQHDYPTLKKLTAGLRSLEVNKPPLVHGMSMSCFECRIMVDAFLVELQSNKSVNALANDLRELVCPRLPASFLLGCTDFINMYGPTVVFMTTQQLTSEQICTGLHMCSSESFKATRQVPYHELHSFKCDSCKEISDYLQRDLSRREFREDVIEEIRHYVCRAVPDSFYYVCDNLAKSYVPLAITKVLQSLEDGHLCHVLHACN